MNTIKIRFKQISINDINILMVDAEEVEVKSVTAKPNFEIDEGN